jgi:hypothetical protein
MVDLLREDRSCSELEHYLEAFRRAGSDENWPQEIIRFN